MAKDCSGYKEHCNFSKKATINQQEKEEVQSKDIKMNYPICCYAMRFLYPNICQILLTASPDRAPEAQTVIESKGGKSWPVYVLSTVMPNSPSGASSPSWAVT